jgi:adenylate cyclase
VWSSINLGATVQLTQGLACGHSGDALDAYRRQDWVEATALFGQALELCPEDGPSRLLAARCAHYRDQPPGEGWDGVHRLSSK